MRKIFNLFIVMLALCGISCEQQEEKHDEENPINKNLTRFELGYYENWGDYYGLGATNWLIDFYTTTSNDYFVLELQGAPSESAPAVGEYQLSTSLEVGTAVAGLAQVDGDAVTLTGTYWCLFDNKWAGLELYAPCVSGTVKVGKSDDLYTIDIDAVDQHGCAIKLSYTGTLTEFDAKTRSNLRRGAAIPVGIK